MECESFGDNICKNSASNYLDPTCSSKTSKTKYHLSTSSPKCSIIMKLGDSICCMCNAILSGTQHSFGLTMQALGIDIITPTQRQLSSKTVFRSVSLTLSTSCAFFSASPHCSARWYAAAASVWNHMHCISFKFSVAGTPGQRQNEIV